jgi:hypothetical protein
MRQVARHVQQKIRRSYHGGSERNVLGVVEHPAKPRPANRQRQRGEHARAGARDQPRRRPCRANAADADHDAKQMADDVDIRRHDTADQNRRDVEQPAVEIEILVGEDAAVFEPAGVVAQDQLAVAVLNLFVVGNCVVAKRQQRGRKQARDQQHRDGIERIGARQSRPRSRWDTARHGFIAIRGHPNPDAPNPDSAQS